MRGLEDADGPWLASPVLEAVAEAQRSAEARRPNLHLAKKEFSSHLLAHVARRCRDVDLSGRIAAVRATHAVDVHLALACERGLVGAWQALVHEHGDGLRGLARTQGLAADAAAEQVDEVFADLVLAPGVTGARTRLASYDGSGTLFSWLAAILIRRLVRSRRRARVPRPEVAEVASDAPDPSARCLEDERAATFDRAFGLAFSSLADRERLALLLKYRDGLPQTALATLLGVGAPRISRIVHSALGKLRAALTGTLSPVDWHESSRSWLALRDVVALRLANRDTGAPPLLRETAVDATAPRA